MDTIELAKKLISLVSVSPEDGGCQNLLGSELGKLGFEVTHLPFGDVSNLWATVGKGSPVFVFAGHTDVVPPGPAEDWSTPPFTPTIIEDTLYGRGAADMKGSLAAMISATGQFLGKYSEPKGTIAFLITSDEEADAVNGTIKVVEHLKKQGVKMDWCIIGEPSSSESLGDCIKVGRRGSLNGDLTIKGVQGHIAYPDEASNPIHNAMRSLADLVELNWDKGNEFFPPTSMQISNIHAGTGTNNVIPGSMSLKFNFRFSTESTAESLKKTVHDLLDQQDLDYDLVWQLSGVPFLTVQDSLISVVQDSIREIGNLETILSTSGGTSDGRFIAPTGTQVVELGPSNKTIHQIDECVKLKDLKDLTEIYLLILQKLLG